MKFTPKFTGVDDSLGTPTVSIMEKTEARTRFKIRARNEVRRVIERRKEKRVKEENRVVIEVSASEGPGDGRAVNAFTKDISLSGVRILTDRLFPLHTRLSLILYLSRSKQVVRIRGTVKSEKKIEEGLYEIGVRFQQGVPDVLMALISHLYGREEGIVAEVSRDRST